MLVKDRIAFERKKKGISTTQLGRLVRVNQATISKYETGNIKIIPSDILEKIVECLEGDFDEFVAEDPKYCSLASKKVKLEDISDDDRMLIAWFHGLPESVQMVIRQLWEIPLTSP
ncbi:MAG: helix-turn-helix transcriptional regulator [Clostridia bacterium]|nr:helix-turn-helix transcriptional regulator [Clostridia bacterium]